MAPWFNPETPKLVGRWRRPVRPSGRNRSYGLVLALVLMVILYFVGCSGTGIRALLEMR
jgi:hypothetical protein